MVKLRLTRMGRHKRAFYRIVATDSRNKVNGGYIELLGHYDPLSNEIKLDQEKILVWLKNGAQPSDTVRNIFKQEGVWAKFIEAKNTKAPKKDEPKKAKPAKTTKK